ncbi:Uncharacterised protein [Salmonella enterica subsp. enterica serovar Typhimurium str. DT104]|nr:Uncharacterised protein [Salmonella enterica subsp. enterica serovar Typhimurium str. DT104]
MRWRAVVIKLRRSARLIADEDQLFRPFTNIQSITMTNVMALPVNDNGARAANINDAQLAAVQ